MDQKRNRIRLFAAGVFITAALAASGADMQVQAAGITPSADHQGQAAIYVQMPGFVVEQWGAPRLMMVSSDATVTVLPDRSSSQLGEVSKGQPVLAWGQTDTGWYFIECGGSLGYVRYEAAAFMSDAQLLQMQAAQQQVANKAAELAQQQAQEAARQQALAEKAAIEAQNAAQEAAEAAAKEAARQAGIAAAAAQQPETAAGIVFIGDSRMVTLKTAVENNLGVCPAAVIAKNGSRYEWFHDSAIPQANAIIGDGSKVVINMGVNDLSDADKYAEDLNFWAAVWTARGAQVYYASVNPVWANSHGITEERVNLFNSRLQSRLTGQIIWLDSHSYLMQSGVHATDGLHYKDDTNLVLYQYYMTMIGAI